MKSQEKSRSTSQGTRRRANCINRVESTESELSSRSGLSAIAEYLEHHGIIKLIAQRLSMMKSSSKGAGVEAIVLQLLCFFIDGTKSSLTWFDFLQRTASHASILGLGVSELISSHTAKRFLRKFTLSSMRILESIELALFQWRLRVEQPQVITLCIDSVVYDNDDAHQRQGVSPTYKKVKGFQPVNVIWNGYTVLSRFRRGSSHGNHGTFVPYAIRKVTSAIREVNPDAEIVFKFDSGFFDEKVFTECTNQGVFCVMTARMVSGVKEAAESVPEDKWSQLNKKEASWRYAQINYKPGSWGEKTGPVSAVYTSLVRDEATHPVLEFARPDQIILTNVDLKHADKPSSIQSAKDVVLLNHSRGKDELVHRGTKEFGTEKMPCKRFFMNGGYYHFMVIAHNLLIAFQRDVVAQEEPELMNATPTTLRRRVIDIAGRVIRTSRRIILKVAKEHDGPSLLERLWSLIPRSEPAFSP